MPFLISRKLGESLTILDDNDEPVGTIEVVLPLDDSGRVKPLAVVDGKIRGGRLRLKVVNAAGRFLKVVRSEKVLGEGERCEREAAPPS